MISQQEAQNLTDQFGSSQVNLALATYLKSLSVDLLAFDPIQGNMPFQSEKRLGFSPLNAELFSVDNAVLLLMLLKLSKTPEGLKTIQVVTAKYFDAVAKILDSVEDSGNTNWVTAGYSQQIAAAMMHRLGLINDGHYIKVTDHIRSTFDKMWQKGFVTDTVSSLTTLVKGSKSQITEHGGMTETGLTALKNIFP